MALLGASTIFALSAGCATTPADRGNAVGGEAPYSPTASQSAVLTNTPTHLHEHYLRLWSEGERSAVLNWMEIGTLAFHSGDTRIAEQAFDAALAGIETIYRNDSAAAEARSLWYSEGRKSFKGEPYERVMAYFYRGLLYLQEGDYGNARASFESGLLQDAFAEEKQYRADFAAMYLLSAWSAEKFDSPELADDAYGEFERLRPDVGRPLASDNVLVVAMTGTSPRKLSDGLGHTKLVFRRGKGFADTDVRMRHANRYLQPGTAVEDLFFQASTRGGRQVDAILEGKVAFRAAGAATGSRASRLGDEVLAATRGSTVGQDTIGRYVGASKALAALATGIGAKVKPQADTRYWRSLPDRLHVAWARLPPVTTSIRIEFVDSDGKALDGMTREAPVDFDRFGNAVVAVASRHTSEQL